MLDLLKRVGAENGDIVFFGADKAKVVNDAMGALRVKIGHDLNLATCEWAPLWVVDFPMFEETDDGKWTSVHHPFTLPKSSVEDVKSNPGEALSVAYDMVLNGTEVGGGSLRIYTLEMQKRFLKRLVFLMKKQKKNSASYSMHFVTAHLLTVVWHLVLTV